MSTMRNASKVEGAFILRKRIDQWRFLEKVFYVGRDGVTFDDGSTGPFRISLEDARSRWRKGLADGWEASPCPF